jgi:hypothetical protein
MEQAVVDIEDGLERRLSLLVEAERVSRKLLWGSDETNATVGKGGGEDIGTRTGCCPMM